MNRLLTLWMKIVVLCVLVVGIVRVLLNIKVMYIDPVTCFADVVRSSVLDIRNKMSKLDGCAEADVVNAFGGIRDLAFSAADLRRNVMAENQISAIGFVDDADWRCSTYRLPFIADYRGLLVVRSNADSSILDYMIVYDGGGDE